MGDGKGSGRRARRRRIGIPFVPNTLLLALVIFGATIVLLLRGGYIPARYSPTAPLDLSDGNAWFVDWRIGELRRDRGMCDRLLGTTRLARVSRISDSVRADGCGWQNAFALRGVGDVRLGRMTLTCPMAVAMTMWVTHVVQPAAERLLGARVKRVRHMGTYACRRIRGSRLGAIWPRKSEHAFANAIDISGFVLADGRSVSVLNHWKDAGPMGQFLREIHAGACTYMSVAIGPNYNSRHADHFHYDRGFFFRCK